MKLVVVGVFERFGVFALRQRSLNTTSCPPTDLLNAFRLTTDAEGLFRGVAGRIGLD